jgi:hypothetical protein
VVFTRESQTTVEKDGAAPVRTARRESAPKLPAPSFGVASCSKEVWLKDLNTRA